MSLPLTDQRISSLVEWLESTLALQIIHWEIASSDASFRRYFRIRHKTGCQIVMDAPPDKERTEPFIRIGTLLHNAKIPVPEIFATNIEQGFLLLEDLGSQSLQDCLTMDNAAAFYKQGLDILFLLQTTVEGYHCQLPAYDVALLERELTIFEEWFLDKRLGITLPISIRNALYQILIDSALEQPQTFVHRDFHSRNLMVAENNALRVIDFQDAVIGPVTYDLVSLLRDCYISWPEDLVETWLHSHFLRLVQHTELTADFSQFKRWFDLMGLQRHLKAIGIFSRLELRDNKAAYLQDIPRTLGYIESICGKYPELADFSEFLSRQVLSIYRSYL